MHRPRGVLAGLGGLTLILTIAGAAEPWPTATVSVETALHVSATDGRDIVLEPGRHVVELTDTGLRVATSSYADRVELHAEPITHSESLDNPLAVVVAGEEDARHVVFLLPNGKGMDVIGSATGMHPRATTGSLTVNSAQLSAAVQTQKLAAGAAGGLAVQAVALCNGGIYQLPAPTPNQQYPSPPGWTCPGDGVILRGIQPATPQVGAGVPVTFSWGQSQTNIPVAYYQICAWVEGSSDLCNTGPGSQLVLLDQVSASQTTLSTRIPVIHQGKAFRWAVRACRSTPDTGTCNATPARRMMFAPSPPVLSSPIAGASISLQGGIFEWQVPYANGISYFLLCVAKPGVACAAQPTLRPDIIVKRAEIYLTQVGGRFVYSLTEDLTRLAGETLHWTAAACGASGCEYQQEVRAITVAFGTPALLSPSDNALIPRPPHGNLTNDVSGTVTFSWVGVPGAVVYKLCLARVGVACQPITRNDPNTFAPFRIRPYREYVGQNTTVTLSVNERFWENAEGGFPYQWTVSACTTADVCHTSPPRPLRFQVRPGTFYWLYPYFQHSKCTTCHSMATTAREGSGFVYTSPKRQQHVNEGRFAANTNVTQGTVCAGCHRADTGFVDNWRAPSGQDFIGKTVGAVCEMIGGKRELPSQMRAHLKEGPRVMWAIRHMTGVTESEWFQLVDAWTAGPDSTYYITGTQYHYPGCPPAQAREEG